MTNFEKEPLGKPVVLFDVDNTLVEGFSAMFFAEYLSGLGLFDTSMFQAMNADLASYREHGDYRKFAEDVVANYSRGFSGQTLSDIEEAGRKFLPQYKAHIYPYTEKLTEMMSGYGYPIAVSGAPKEAFSHLAQDLRIYEVHLLEAQVDRGKYTGEVGVNMALDREKRRVVDIINLSENMKKSYAFGDSIHDLPLLEAVTFPFVVGNRDTDLAELARQKGWPQVDGNNIINGVQHSLSR